MESAKEIGPSSLQHFLSQSIASWDPEHRVNEVPASNDCLLRITKDLRSICKYVAKTYILILDSDPAPGICVVPDNEDMTKIYALITGPFDTPYEGGFFLFLIRCPPEYPLTPPKVKLMTTGNGTVRFNPNFYSNGKVCLSVLGTWQGPEWTPAQSLSSVLISIQSLMNDKPYFNEPGFNIERNPGDAQQYNAIITHETIRCAVCDVLEGRTIFPPDLYAVVESSFEDYYEYYTSVCERNMHLSGQPMVDPFEDGRGIFDYANLLKRLKALNNKVKQKHSGINEANPMSIRESK
ncbi:Ubiquitin-conjugating enzyme E2 Z isoform 2 [Schistosoma japonicum]|uniref:Ubiquitin-conjugating enzyme E2 Z n=1 Tax=Schistosoma japonicum TaxID=6182 RepID=A0A4Z2CSQ7_SCHJA|nr:Ubiquitin-conjugating enzyme E2 Z isoform 2 [Schistosoma japonicum]TNN07267.1 Ubiquitin-conjugating enzyme E2 Z isoform 2 [Schistosoma japonicum]